MGTSEMDSSRPADVDLLAAAPDGIVVINGAGDIVAVNVQLEQMFGYRRGELVGQPLERLLPERFREQHLTHRKSYFAAPSRRPMGLQLALFGRRRNGDEFPVDISLNSDRDAQGEVRAVAFVRDVTERRSLEEELRTSEENFRLLVENVGDHALLMLDAAGCVVSWNPGAERVKGWQAHDILGRHFSVFYVPEEVAAGRPARDLERAASEGRAEDAGWRVRGDGRRFWAETTLSAVRDSNGVLRGYAKVTRDRTESHQARTRVEAVSDLNRAALEQRPDDELILLLVARVRAMVDATLAAAWVPDSDGSFAVATAAGDGATSIVAGGSADSIVAQVARSGRCEFVADVRADPRVPDELVQAGVGTAVFVPLGVNDETFAVLGVMRSSNLGTFQPHEIDLLQSFGMQAAAAFALARARRDVEQLQLVSDRERIARDLHDSVIQRLFAVGLSLEATGRRPAAEVQERLRSAVAEIDDTIRAIRSVIFSLEAHEDAHPGLRAQVLDVAADAATALSFDPSVAFEGPVDTLADDVITANLVAVLREALTNVARHAQATAASVTVSAGTGEVALLVEDDGTGSPGFHRDGGHGVANLAERARVLGGSASVTALTPHGTRVEWRVPASGSR